MDENRLAEGSAYFALGGAVVSHDHDWLAYATDRSGNEKFELRFLPLDADTAPSVAAEVGPRRGLRPGLVCGDGLRLLRPPR